MKLKSASVLMIIGCALCWSVSCSRTSDTFRMPAEWEPQEAVWLGWEKNASYEYYPAVVQMIRALTPSVQVKMAFDSDSLKQEALRYLLAEKVDTSVLRFYILPGERYWIRDHGAAFLTNDQGELAVADFGWNGYGYPGFLSEKYNANEDSIKKALSESASRSKMTGQVDSLMAVTENAAIRKTDVIHEGGAIEVNGKGTLILCEATVFQRNPGKSKEYIEAEFKRVLGVRNIVWLKQGLADDPLHFFRRITDNFYGGGTGGHTDEFVRFANASTILLAWVNEDEKDAHPIHAMNYERMRENLQILEAARDQDGKPFTIVKVPLPDVITEKVAVRSGIGADEVTHDIDRDSFVPAEAPTEVDSIFRVPAASYLNYLVSNKVVLLPSYTAVGSSAEKEEEVSRIFKEYFPDREVVLISAMPQNWNGGGIHCSTQQQPAKKK